ncbi:MAG TPA: response regulator [Candidatus Binataceae bacterium]|jgi:two-component system response regulator CpxR|nr:response regulator [Candidatus Binataceae bacterium]
MKTSIAKSTILVVDDDADCREMLSDLLSREGYTVACAENGREALDYISSTTPSLMILDLMMPVMSGWELLDRQKTDPRMESLPVVVVSASGLAQDIHAEAVLRKPVDFKALMNVVKQNSTLVR